MTVKYILVALESVNRYSVRARSESEEPILDTYSAVVREDNGFARQYDSFERAMQAWNLYRQGRKDSFDRMGWVYRPDEEDDDSALRMKKFKNGFIREERLVVPQIYAIKVPDSPKA